MKCSKTGCKANAMKDDEYCFWHSPKTEKQRKAAGRRGGSRSKLQTEVVDIQSIEDIRVILSEAISELRSSSTENRIGKARAIGYLCSIALVALEKGDLESCYLTRNPKGNELIFPRFDMGLVGCYHLRLRRVQL